jgi:hypothetical protein
VAGYRTASTNSTKRMLSRTGCLKAMTEEDVRANIAAQRMRAKAAERAAEELADDVEEVEAEAAAAREFLTERGVSAGDSLATTGEADAEPQTELGSWEEMTAANRSWLTQAGLEDLSLDQLLTPEQLDELESFDPKGRERWSAGDFVTVGGCAVLGVLATAFDDQVDKAVKLGLQGVGKTRVLKAWEKQGKQLPIDYTGPKFGGPGHRVRSAGHDIGRPFEALAQIRDGTFRGVYWEHGELVRVAVKGPWAARSPQEALVVWLKHISADLVTTCSLPLPWWSKLYECDSRDLRKLAHDLYLPSDGFGMNLRSMLISKTLPVITSELIVGVKVHLDARERAGKWGRLSANETLRRNEMLLAAHATTGLAAVGKVLFVGYGGDLLALRHLNAPALARAGYVGLKVVREHRRRTAGRRVPTWDELLHQTTLPWELDELAVMKAAVSVGT